MSVQRYSQMRDCGPVDVVELHRPTLSAAVDIPVPPSLLFEILEDAEAWPRWLTAITKVVWTSPDPKGVGTTRTVEIGRGFLANEEFIAWEANQRMAFRFEGCSRPIFRAFAEDYRIESADGGCRLTWSVLIRPRGVPESMVKVVGPVLAIALRRNLDRLRIYAVTRYAQA